MRTLSAIVMLFFVAGCSGSGVEGGDSPQDVFNRFKDGLASGNYEIAFRCIGPEERDGMLFGPMMILGFMTMETKEIQTELEAIQKKHGVREPDEDESIDLDDEEAMNAAVVEAFKDVKNKPALFHDLMDLVAKYDDQPQSFLLPEEAKLTDVKIEGDTATGTISSDKRDKDVAFVKKGERWYCKFE